MIVIHKEGVSKSANISITNIYQISKQKFETVMYEKIKLFNSCTRIENSQLEKRLTKMKNKIHLCAFVNDESTPW